MRDAAFHQVGFREPDCGAADIAAALKLSPSTVHRAWSGEEGSNADWIWALRLETARAEFVDPRWAARSISTAPPYQIATRSFGASHIGSPGRMPKAR